MNACLSQQNFACDSVQIVERLFKFYFEQERDITDLETLAEAAAAVGLDKVITSELRV